MASTGMESMDRAVLRKMPCAISRSSLLNFKQNITPFTPMGIPLNTTATCIVNASMGSSRSTPQ